MKNKIIIGNWKQNPEKFEDCLELLEITEKYKQRLIDKNIFITHAVPSIFIGLLLENNKSKNIENNLILQDISCFEGGSHTGEISNLQAKNLGIEMSLVGHSETRLSKENPRGDEDKQVNLKIKNLLKQNMKVCLCVGEYIRDENYLEFIKMQIDNAFLDVENSELEEIVLAYEPVWAIGKNAVRVATDEEIFDTIEFIKKYLNEKYSLEENKILYGGSVDENNINKIINMEIVDGTLVGRASSDKAKWAQLLGNLVN